MEHPKKSENKGVICHFSRSKLSTKNKKKKKKMDDKLIECSCFLIKKVSHTGTFRLCRTRVEFLFSTEEEASLIIKIKDIKSTVYDKKFAVNNFEIQTEDEVYRFSGMHEAEAIKEYISLLQSQLEKVSDSYGFIEEEVEEEIVKYKPLANPTILVSLTLPMTIANFRAIMDNPQTHIDFYQSLGNEDVKLSEWQQGPGYIERNIDYLKLVVVPVIGKNLIHVIEYQKLFEIEGGFVIHVSSNLGKTPYADCFDPYIQIISIDKGDKTEVTVNQEIVWKSEPFVKSIVESQTTQQVKEQYNKFFKEITKDLGGGESEEQEDAEQDNAAEDKFRKTKIIYKVSIIILLFILIGAFIWKSWPRGGVHYSWQMLFRLFVFAFFIFALVVI